MKPKRQMHAGGISLHSEQVSVGKPAVAKCCKSGVAAALWFSNVFNFPPVFPPVFRACVALHALRHEGNPASFQPECFPYADLWQRWTLQCIDPEKMQTHNKGLTPGLGEHEYLRWAAVRGSSHPRYLPLWLFRDQPTAMARVSHHFLSARAPEAQRLSRYLTLASLAPCCRRKRLLPARLSQLWTKAWRADRAGRPKHGVPSEFKM